eukprot:1376031-Amorphochlora_amoeboformis.AAC.1
MVWIFTIGLIWCIYASFMNCYKEYKEARRREERLEIQRKIDEEKRKEDAEKKRILEKQKSELMARLEKTDYSVNMKIEDFLQKIALIELKESSIKFEKNIKTLKKKWICFAGDLAAYTVEKVQEDEKSIFSKSEAIVIEQKLRAISETATKTTVNGIQYVIPEVDFNDETPIQDFLPMMAKANGLSMMVLDVAIKALDHNCIAKISQLRRVVSGNEDGSRAMREQVFPQAVLQAKLWGYLMTGK